MYKVNTDASFQFLLGKHSQHLSDPHGYSGSHKFPTTSTDPKMYSFGYRSVNHQGLSGLAESHFAGYESMSTRTAAPPSNTSLLELQALQNYHTPRRVEDVAPYSLDDDGDVVMADLEDLKAIMDVMHHVHEKRFKDETIYKQELPNKLPINYSRIPDPAFLLVMDTSFILSHLHLVESIVSLHEPYRSVVLIPWATIQELDGLRKSSGRITTTSSVGLKGSNHAPRPARTVEVAKLARQAVNWQHKMFQIVHKGVWGQRREESIERNLSGDDAILDCCRYFSEREGILTVLLSDDRNLCVKARVYDLLTVSFDPGVTHTARQILDKVAAEIRSVKASSSPSNQMPPRSPPAPYMPAYRQSSPLTQSYTPNYNIIDKDAQMEDAPMTSSPTRLATHNSSPIMGGSYHCPGLQYSRYSPQGQPQPPSTTSRFSSVHLPYPQTTISARPMEPSIDSNRELRSSVYYLLERAFTDIMASIPTLMHYRALSAFGNDEYALNYFKINLRRMQDLEQIEQELSKHWHTVFNECVNYEIGVKAKESKLSQPYKDWSAWAGSRPGTKPRKIELKTWLADWTSLWKSLWNKINVEQGPGVLDENLHWRKTEKWSRQLEMMAL
ncbi:PIN domain-containing protein [Kalaharituber pfeilii]|nr:PIN domain-containing protein [Kalaharituber pfeilii]